MHFGTVNTRILGWRLTSGPQWSSLWESSVRMAAQRDELPTAVLKCIGLTGIISLICNDAWWSWSPLGGEFDAVG